MPSSRASSLRFGVSDDTLAFKNGPLPGGPFFVIEGFQCAFEAREYFACGRGEPTLEQLDVGHRAISERRELLLAQPNAATEVAKRAAPTGRMNANGHISIEVVGVGANKFGAYR
jgi:hypothetical protein